LFLASELFCPCWCSSKKKQAVVGVPIRLCADATPTTDAVNSCILHTSIVSLAYAAARKYVQFFTATILEWKHLLKPDKYKQLILDSLKFLVEHGRVKVYGFVIMINHIHVVWHIQPQYKREDVQRIF
jgi:hypothetical protein